MTRDEAAWLEMIRRGQDRNWKDVARQTGIDYAVPGGDYTAYWHVGRDYPGAPLKCYYIDPKYLRLRKMDAPMWQTPFRKRTDLSDTWVSYIHGAPYKLRLHAALRRFWRATKG